MERLQPKEGFLCWKTGNRATLKRQKTFAIRTAAEGRASRKRKLLRIQGRRRGEGQG